MQTIPSFQEWDSERKGFLNVMQLEDMLRGFFLNVDKVSGGARTKCKASTKVFKYRHK